MDDIFDTRHTSRFDPAGAPPPQEGDWQSHSHEGEAGRGGSGQQFQCVDFCPICRTADVLRVALPDEFQEQWHALQRDGLMAARTLLDHYIKHLESRRPGPVRVEDIPIE